MGTKSAAFVSEWYAMCFRFLVASGLLPAVLLGTQGESALAAHRQVFLLGGQSNMVGTGNPDLPPAQPFVAPLPDVRLYFGISGTSPPPTAYEWIDLAPGSGGEFGPELSFGHTLHLIEPNDNYALIKHARGGSNVSADWNPTISNNVYADFRTTVDGGLQELTDAGDTYDIVGMLWTQGIRDGKDGNSAALFQEGLERLIADVRLNYGPDLPVFISRLSINMTGANPSTPVIGGRGDDPDDFGLAGIRRGQENVVAHDPLAFLIDTDTFGIGDPSHFNTSGQIDLGKAFANSYVNNVVVPEPNTAAIAFVLFATVVGPLWRTYALRGAAVRSGRPDPPGHSSNRA